MNLQVFKQALVIASAIAAPAAPAADRDRPSRSDSYVERAADIAMRQPGPHQGDGTTTAYPFFEQANDFNIVFRQRALHPGASIGEHTNDKDEIYYIVSGQGELMLDGKRITVVAGDAVLTRNGSRHGLRQTGSQDLTLMVVYMRKR